MSRRQTQRHMRRPICAGDANCCKKLILILQLVDIERICAETGWHPRRFVRLYHPDDFIEGENEEDVWIETAQGKRLMGTRRKRDQCFFLCGDLCTVYGFKPLNCTIYPVDYRYPKGRTVVTCRGEKWCGATRGELVPVDEYLRLGEKYDREAKRTERFVRRWNSETKAGGSGGEFFEALARHVRREIARATRRSRPKPPQYRRPKT